MIQPFSEFNIDGLDPAQKLDLIGILWDSVPESIDKLPIPEWHTKELDERLLAADIAPETAIPWEQVRERLRERP